MSGGGTSAPTSAGSLTATGKQLHPIADYAKLVILLSIFFPRIQLESPLNEYR
jgi:hypothetical protein